MKSTIEAYDPEEEFKRYFRLPEPMKIEDKIKILNNAMSVTFVRHPFERLVSTFKDRIIGSLKFLFKKYYTRHKVPK